MRGGSAGSPAYVCCSSCFYRSCLWRPLLQTGFRSPLPDSPCGTCHHVSSCGGVCRRLCPGVRTTRLRDPGCPAASRTPRPCLPLAPLASPSADRDSALGRRRLGARKGGGRGTSELRGSVGPPRGGRSVQGDRWWVTRVVLLCRQVPGGHSRRG